MPTTDRRCLKILRASYGEQMQIHTFGAEFLFSSGVVNFDGREGIVVQAHDVFALEEAGGADGVVHVHGEIATDAKRGEIKLGRFADEFHVQGQGGIAGMIKVAFRGLDDEAAGASAVGAIGQGTGMDGVHKFRTAKTKGIAAAGIQGMGILDAVFAQPLTDFEIGNDRGASLVGEGNGIRDMVTVPMGNKDIIGLDLFDIHALGERVWGDEGIEENVFSVNLGGEAGVSVVSDFHYIPFSFLIWLKALAITFNPPGLLRKFLNSLRPQITPMDADLAGRFYFRQRRRRNALPMTMRSDTPMAAAQKMGLMNPSAASGTPSAL